MNELLDYIVVINIEEQFSIWPSNRDIPIGWESVNFTGNKDECLNYIEEHWIDMRPKSIR
ncbi:MbtH family NRPS accessory protein [Niallia taxi]|uniref:MbtH family protein n=1 Tax=Niallia taxi TaxID=2499688 RepID=UPI0020404985|nr:MbtH family NRPS accessory protein [Niallia taxi]MCM3216695.1 MbtH family NRPS accessory protein [Niallia taxi]